MPKHCIVIWEIELEYLLMAFREDHLCCVWLVYIRVETAVYSISIKMLGTLWCGFAEFSSIYVDTTGREKERDLTQS